MIKSYRRMLQAAGSFAPEMRLALQLSALASVIQGIIFALFFPLLRTLFTHPLDGGTVWTILGIMMGLILLEAIVRWQEMGITHAEAMVRISHELRLKLGEQLRCMPLEQLNRRQAGDLSMVLSGNVMDVTLPMSNILGMIIQTIVVPIVTIAATFFFDWRLALVLLVAFPLSVPLYQRLHTLNLRGFREMNAVNAKAASRIIEYVQGLPVLRATNQVGKQAGQLQEALVNQHTTQVHSHQLVTIPHVLMSTLVQSSILLVLALGALFILQGTLTLPVLGALLVIAVRFSEPISQLAAFNQVFDLMESGLERIEELLAVQPLSSSTTPAHITQHDITFEHVSFTYTDQPESVLHNVSFHLPPHSFTALVGPSGGGKTTITRLISRYADVQHGSVCIGGIDVRNVEPSELMRHISVVFQDVYLFDDTILANIRLARLDASNAEIEEAARAANCHEFITRLPQGYETRIGEIGNMLSGGERQRIAIARALLKDTPIVLLDEPTSALDTESEAAVQTAIDRLVADRTIVVIAHRLSTIVAADTILVLDGGSIVEQGSHTELLAHEGRYAAMWRAQQSTQRWRVGTAQ